MNPGWLYLRMKARLWRHWAAAQLVRPARTGLTLLVGAAVWGALYGMFRSGLAYTALIPWLDTYLVSGLFAVFFLLVWLLLVLTSIVLTHYGLYYAPEAGLLMHLPVAPARAALYRSIELGVYNSLGAVYLGTPLIAAFAVAEELPRAQVAVAILLLLPLVIIPHCAGTVLTILLRRVAGRVPARLLAIGGVLVFLASLFALLATFDFGVFNEQDHPVRLLNQTASALSGVRKWFLPSHWYVQAVFSPVRGYPRMVWWFAGVLGTAAAASLVLWVTVIRLAYYPSWLAGGETAEAADRPPRMGVNRLAQWAAALRPLPGAARALLAKDALLFVREPVVRTQGVVLIGILLVYFASLRSVYTGYAHQPVWMVFVSGVNFAALGVLLSAFACRFLLPLISLEGRKYWLLRTAPPRLESVLLEKWFFSTTVLLVLGHPLLALSNYMTAMDRVFVIVSHAALCALIPAVCAVATGMGAMFPDLRGGGGHTGTAATLAFVLCLVCVAGFVLLIGWPYAVYLFGTELTYPVFLRRLVLNIGGGAAISWGAGLLVATLGHARLSRAEIP